MDLAAGENVAIDSSKMCGSLSESAVWWDFESEISSKQDTLLWGFESAVWRDYFESEIASKQDD